MGVPETRQNGEAIERHPKKIGIEEMLLDPGSPC